MDTSKTAEIYNNFSKYIKNNDKRLIENYNLEELKATKYKYYSDKNFPQYHAVVDRIEELVDIEKSKRTSRERWKDRIIGIAIGLMLTCASIVLKNLLTQNPK